MAVSMISPPEAAIIVKLVSLQIIVKILSFSEFVSTYFLFPCDTADTTGSEAHSTSLAGLSLVSALKTKLPHINTAFH